MKLFFKKKPDGDIYVKMGDTEFSAKCYVELVKVIKKGESVEAEFDEAIEPDEQKSVCAMMEALNGISITPTEDDSVESEEPSQDDDLPF